VNGYLGVGAEKIGKGACPAPALTGNHEVRQSAQSILFISKMESGVYYRGVL
jgi:hypothetical protein